MEPDYYVLGDAGLSLAQASWFEACGETTLPVWHHWRGDLAW